MFPKPKNLVSKKLRQSAKGKMCTLRLPGICNHNPETTVLCHINTKYKGMGNKSNDIHAYYGCSSCHANEYKASGKDLLRAMVETQAQFLQQGLIKVA